MQPSKLSKHSEYERREPPAHHLHQIELANRWRISPRTLERWRWLQQGPPYLKVGGRVVYRLVDVEAFEVAQRREPDAKAQPAAWGHQ